MSIEISEIVRTKRKTIALVVTVEAKLIVLRRCPRRRSTSEDLLKKGGIGLSESNRKWSGGTKLMSRNSL